MRLAAPAPTVTSFEQLPLVCSLEHVSRLYGRSELGIRRAVRRGTFPVMPFMVNPMRWNRSELQAHLEGGATMRRPLRAVAGTRR